MTRSDVGQGPSRVLPGHGGAARRARFPARSTSTSSTIRPIRSRTSARPAPRSGSRCSHDVDAVVCGVGSGGTLTGSAAIFARVRPETEMVLADPAARCSRRYVETGKIGEAGSWVVEGIGEDFIPPIADLSRVKKAYSIPDAESFATARELLQARGHPRRLVDRHAARRGAALLPRADRRPSASSRFVLRHRQQVSLEDVQRLLDGRPGLPRAPRYGDLRDLVVAPLRGRRDRLGRPRRHAAHRVPAHARRRRLAAAGARRATASSASSTNPTCCCTSTRSPSASATRSRPR